MSSPLSCVRAKRQPHSVGLSGTFAANPKKVDSPEELEKMCVKRDPAHPGYCLTAWCPTGWTRVSAARHVIHFHRMNECCGMAGGAPFHFLFRGSDLNAPTGLRHPKFRAATNGGAASFAIFKGCVFASSIPLCAVTGRIIGYLFHCQRLFVPAGERCQVCGRRYDRCADCLIFKSRQVTEHEKWPRTPRFKLRHGSAVCSPASCLQRIVARPKPTVQPR
jgi:hypothetical protein